MIKAANITLRPKALRATTVTRANMARRAHSPKAARSTAVTATEAAMASTVEEAMASIRAVIVTRSP